MASLSFDGLNKGRYVELTSNGTKARRQLGFCDGVVISATHIKPGQLVAVEILETQPGWSGDLRVGFTLLPDESLHPLPSFAIPELVTRGHSWIFPVGNAASLLVSHRRRAYWRRQQQQRRSTRGSDSRIVNSRIESSPLNRPDTLNRHVRTDGESSVARRVHLNPASPCTCCLYTTFGRVPLRSLLPTDGIYLRPPDVEKGSIVAIYYELEACSTASIHEYSDPSTGYFHWHSMSQSDQGIEADGDGQDIENIVDDMMGQVNLPVHPESAVLESDAPSQSNTNHGSQPLDSLSFQFFFHIVINGIDLITISEKITLRRDQLCPSLPTSVVEGINPVEETMQATIGSCTPKMRAVLDVYGQTKAVRLVPLNQDAVPRLSRLSSCAILRRIVQIHAPKIRINGCNMGHSHTNSNSSLTEPSGRTCKRAKSSLFPAYNANDSRPIWSNCSTFNHVTDNHRCKVLLTIVNQLPLPLFMRRELQRDVCAIVWRELIE